MGLLSAAVCASTALEEIDKMVERIQKPRQGIGLDELASTKDPFISLKKDENMTQVVIPKKKEAQLSLNGILNGKAYINGKWYKVGDKISGYVLKYVGTKGVVLTDETHIKKLFLHKNEKGLITIKEGK